MKVETNKKTEVVFFIIVAVVMFLPVLGLGEKPGLYFDAVNPDYAAQQILSPQQYSVQWNICNPFLTQLYMGAANLWISLISTMIIGTTSAALHHMEGTVLMFFCLLALYIILKKLCVNKIISFCMISVMAVLPTVFTIPLTQSYGELPGVLLMEVSLIFLILWKERRKDRYLFGIFYLAGFSFYTYFNFLFFLPVLLFMIAFNISRKEKCKKVILSLYSYACGCVFYFVGYTVLYLGDKPRRMQLLLGCGCVILVVFLLTFLMFRWTRKNNGKAVFVALMLTGALGIFWMLKVMPAISLYYEAYLSIANEKVVGLESIRLNFKYISEILTGSQAERLIYAAVYTRFHFLFKALFASSSILYFSIVIKNKENILKESSFQFMLAFIIYFVFCIFFSSRMMVHHFVPLLFLMFIIFSLQLNYILKNIKMIKAAFIKIGMCAACACILINLYNRYQVIDNIQRTGGVGFYTDQINQLAYDALEKRNQGVQEVYLFYDWGFFAGFNYLTQNKVPFYWIQKDDADTVRYFEWEGYDVVLCYWNHEDSEKNKSLLQSVSDHAIEEKTYYQRDAVPAFYMIKQFANKNRS